MFDCWNYMYLTEPCNGLDLSNPIRSIHGLDWIGLKKIQITSDWIGLDRKTLELNWIGLDWI